MSGHAPPRLVAGIGLAVTAVGAGWLSRASSDAPYAVDLLPGLVVLGLGVGMVFVAVSGTALAGIPPSTPDGLGFLMTGHEVGAALGVAVSRRSPHLGRPLTTAAGAAEAFTGLPRRSRPRRSLVRGVRGGPDAGHQGERSRRYAHARLTRHSEVNNTKEDAMKAITQYRYGSADVLRVRKIGEPAGNPARSSSRCTQPASPEASCT